MISRLGYISDDDYNYLQNPPRAFTWKLKKIDYSPESFLKEDLSYITEEVNYIDTSMIIPTGEINGHNLITKADIDKAMVNLAFSEFTENNDLLNKTDAVNATEDAIKLALEENISLLSEDFKFIIREINIEDVIKIIETKKPQVISLEESLNKELVKAIKESDKTAIKDVLKKFEKLKIEPVMKTQADAKLEEIQARIDRPKEQPTDIPDIPSIPKKDKKELVKSFKSRSVVSSRRNI